MAATTQDALSNVAAAKAEALSAVFSGQDLSAEQRSVAERHRAEREAAAREDREFVETYDVTECLELLAAQILVARPQDRRILPFICECATDTLRHRADGTAAVGIADVCEEVYEHDVRGAAVMEQPLPTIAAPNAGPEGPVVLYAPPHRGRVDAIRLALTCAGIPHRTAWVGWERFREQGLRLPGIIIGPAESDQRQMVTEYAAVLRYVANVAGLYPEDPLQAAKADSIVYRLQDVRLDQLIFADGGLGSLLEDDLVAAVLDEHLEGSWAAILQSVHDVKADHVHKGPFLLGQQLCHADLVSGVEGSLLSAACCASQESMSL